MNLAVYILKYVWSNLSYVHNVNEMHLVMNMMKSGERETDEGTELSDQESITTLREKENFMHLAIFEADTIKQKRRK